MQNKRNYEELAPDLEQCKERYWDGRDLPFPILFDETGSTIRRLGITGYPTILLIDPEGKLCREGGPGMLVKELMRTDPKVQEHTKKLGRVGLRTLKRNANEVASIDDEAAAWALLFLVERETERSEKKVLMLLPILAGMKTEMAHQFLLGEYGLHAERPKVRLAAIKAFRSIEDPPEIPPWRIRDTAKREKDKKVKALLQEWHEELLEKAQAE